MNRIFFFPRLAATNIRKNSRMYVPFILTCICTVAMFYNIVALTYNNSTLESGTISQMMGVGMYVTAIFSCIFLFYTNSFLVKKRKKEFGLYNILGMQKKHIGIIMAYETAMVG